jgi:hypothetical protein
MIEQQTRYFYASENDHFFFGYYDKTNFDASDTFILSHKTKFIDRFPGEADLVEIGFITLQTGVFTKLGCTNAWNWQEGSMLQFYRNKLNESAQLIYNIIKNNCLISEVIDLEGEVLFQCPIPVAAVNQANGKIASFDFHKLKSFRKGYHYAPSYEPTEILQNNIVLYDPKRSEVTELISLKECQRKFFRPSMRAAKHFFQHCIFSPDGDKLSFLHRWRESNGNMHSHLIILNLTTGYLENASKSSRCTHFAWIDNDNLILFTSKGNSATKLRQYISNTMLESILIKLYRKLQKGNKIPVSVLQKDNYFRYDTNKSELIAFTNLDNSDGHPHNLDDTILVSDTYPNTDGIQKLLFFNKTNGTLLHEISFDVDATNANSPLRCDFHPRVSPNKNFISVDIVQAGRRSQCVLKL